MLARRLLVLIAVLMGLTALAASVAPRQPLPSERGSPAPPASAGSPAAAPLERTLDADAGRPTRVVVRTGQTLVLEVTSAAIDSVSIEGLAEIEPVEADSPARFELLAETPGTHPVELLQAERRIGTIEIVEAGG
jgi:hypothetical protein